MHKQTLENIYDKYCCLLYGIAIQICPAKKMAEQILIKTFIKIYKQGIIPETCPSYCITLIRLILKTAEEEHHRSKVKNTFKLKQFESTPLLHEIICNQITLQDYCAENYLTQQEGLQILREEFKVIKKGSVLFKNDIILKEHRFV